MSATDNVIPVPAVVLIAALPEETNTLLKRIGARRQGRLAGFPLFSGRVGGQELLLLQSGMGPKNAGAATRAILDLGSPELIINFGLGGAVAPGPQVADLVVATRLLVKDSNGFGEQAGVNQSLANAFIICIGNNRCRTGTFVTAGETMPKAALRSALPAGTETPVLEMETAAIAGATGERGVPLLAIRAISDDSDEELGFTVAEFCDENLQLRPLKVFLTILKRPGIIPQLIRLAGSSSRAAETLATAIITFLEQRDA